MPPEVINKLTLKRASNKPKKCMITASFQKLFYKIWYLYHWNWADHMQWQRPRQRWPQGLQKTDNLWLHRLTLAKSNEPKSSDIPPPPPKKCKYSKPTRISRSPQGRSTSARLHKYWIASGTFEVLPHVYIIIEFWHVMTLCFQSRVKITALWNSLLTSSWKFMASLQD